MTKRKCKANRLHTHTFVYASRGEACPTVCECSYVYVRIFSNVIGWGKMKSKNTVLCMERMVGREQQHA